MAKGGVERGALLPVSADDGKGNGGGAGGDDAVLFKGSAMTRRGGAAALSYMACSGTRGFICLFLSRRLLAVRPCCWCTVLRSLRSGNLGTGEHLHHVFDSLPVLVATFPVGFSLVRDFGARAGWVTCAFGLSAFGSATELFGRARDRFPSSVAMGYAQSAQYILYTYMFMKFYK
jgi:hypothetical protein